MKSEMKLEMRIECELKMRVERDLKKKDYFKYLKTKLYIFFIFLHNLQLGILTSIITYFGVGV